MASSAVLRLACRVLSLRPSSFQRSIAAEGELFLHRPSMPPEIIGPRRLYSTELNPKLAKKTSSEESVSTKLDTISSNYEEIGNTYKQILVALGEKRKRQRRRRQVFVGGSILTGLFIYFKAPFFRKSQEAEGQ